MALACWPELRRLWERRGVHYLGYQIEAARRAVEDLGGRAILADEVGLGKTIEAGLVTRELMARHGIRRVLVLVPTPLVSQWAAEFRDKFALPLAVNPRGAALQRAERIVTSLDLAKRDEQRRILQARTWDLVIVDEAHKLKNRNTQAHAFVRGLATRYLLLLSATPLQNDLTELYSLVSLVRPDLFGSYSEFWRNFLLDKRTPKDPQQLKQVLARVMIRNRRAELDLPFPAREVELVGLDPFPEERELYEAVLRAVREEYAERRLYHGTVLPLLTLQREVCSSSHALRATLERLAGSEGWQSLAWTRVRELARQVDENHKAQMLERLIHRLDEPVVVFTEFRATQDYLARRLRRAGIETVVYHGAMGAAERDAATARFRRGARVLISTECGGQGVNLQFCRNVVNYDLPWNPMRVEQRIGRVHRLGQQAESVRVFNLYARRTIEEYILRLLDEKINLFRQVIGEIDLILRSLDREKSIEARIAEITLSSRDDAEMAARFERFGNELAAFMERVRRRTLAWMGSG
ncbi:DEAD/DEAH box helicase [Thermaerobacter composti]|uniref:SNF2-related protein n=1 Tax=Thermaerobacter composti TaxID=554949 RepID=A0ABZ0QTE6_9FIRM|nr:SNF2-related protein [Thermaerobacter composti]WPD20102.1 SNF2-related protein [Thermaerobacter composti]